MPAKTLTRRRLSVYFANTAMQSFVLDAKDKIQVLVKEIVITRANGDTIHIERLQVAYRVLTTFTEEVKPKPNRVITPEELIDDHPGIDLL